MKKNGDQPLERKVLRYEIKKRLTESILNGEILPGGRIVETKIAKELNVSQAPVREAIRELEQMGLVETQPYRGAFVKSIKNDELVEAYQLRSLVEGYAAKILAKKIDDNIINEFSPLIQKMKDSAQEHNRTQFIELDVAFHELLVKSTGSSLIHRVWSIINMAHLPYLTFTKATVGLETLIIRHEAILAALIKKDSEEACKQVQVHIEELGSKIFCTLN